MNLFRVWFVWVNNIMTSIITLLIFIIIIIIIIIIISSSSSSSIIMNNMALWWCHAWWLLRPHLPSLSPIKYFVVSYPPPFNKKMGEGGKLENLWNKKKSPKSTNQQGPRPDRAPQPECRFREPGEIKSPRDREMKGVGSAGDRWDYR